MIKNKTGFKNRLDPKKDEVKVFPHGMSRNEYDKRSGCFVSQGTNYGSGVNQPVGTEKSIGHLTSNSPIPYGRVKTLDIYDES